MTRLYKAGLFPIAIAAHVGAMSIGVKCSPRALSSACATNTPRFPAFESCDNRILLRELVAVRAVSFPGVSSAHAKASQDIHARRDGLGMIRIEATSVAAKMVEFLAVRDWSDKDHISSAVREVYFRAADNRTHSAITVFRDRSRPVPAAFYVAVGGNAVDEFHWSHMSVIISKTTHIFNGEIVS